MVLRELKKAMAEKSASGAAAADDLQLAQAALRDSKTEEALLRRLYPKIFQVAWANVGSRWLADEVAQVAAVEVIKSLSRFRGVGSLESWAGRITCRVASKILKRERRSWVLVPLVDDDNAATQEPLDIALSRRRLFERLVGEMDRIPRKRRVPLQLHLVYGYTVGEVAEMTKTSPNTVKDRLRTAYKELRSILERHPNLRKAMLEEIP